MVWFLKQELRINLIPLLIAILNVLLVHKNCKFHEMRFLLMMDLSSAGVLPFCTSLRPVCSSLIPLNFILVLILCLSDAIWIVTIFVIAQNVGK